MKLLVVTPTFLGEDDIVGGAEQYVYSVTKALSESEKINDVNVIFFSPEKTTRSKVHAFVKNGIKTFYCDDNMSNPIPTLDSLLFSNYDVLYLHQYNTWLTCLFSWSAKLKGKKVVLTDHNGGGKTFNRRLGVSSNIDINFHTSKISLEDTSFGIKKNVRVFGGVDINFFKKNLNVTRDRDFLFVGRLHSIKGIDLLIEASRKCTVQHTLTLVVSSQCREDIQKLKEETESLDQIRIFVNQNKEQLREHYSSHNWIVLPSKKAIGRENLGLTVLEGMSCGMNAACSPHCGVGEMKEEYPTDSISIIEDWSNFFNSKAGNSVDEKSRVWIEKNATWESVASRILSHL